MATDDDEIRRRLERLEGIQAELQALMRESTLMIARLNEIVDDIKKELGRLPEAEKEVARIKVSVSFAQWIGGAIVSSGIVLILAYVFKVPTP